jgi:undecaprenyl-diphosphatase
MEYWNQTLFLLLNAAPHASGIVVEAAHMLAGELIWIVPLGMIFGWLRGSTVTRHALVAAMASGLVALLINQLIGLLWYHPRPFEAGIGRTLMRHVQDSSFPSDHVTLIWAVAFSLLLHERFRAVGWTLAFLGLPVAWARIYLGVHFPMDMLGAALVAFGSAWLTLGEEHRFVAPVVRVVQRPYRRVFSGLINKGWMRQ